MEISRPGVGFLKIAAIFLLFAGTYASAQTIRTVGTAGNYTSLRTAFAAINNGTVQGEIILQIISSVADNTVATLNASGTGSANYSSITIYPTGSGHTLSGSNNGPMFSFNGADNVTFDGRVNQTGNANLTISNINPNLSVSTIQFANSAENNSIQYCNIRGISGNPSGGVIFFSTSTSGNGNDGNIIENCNITSYSATRIVNAIYSAGSAGRDNSNNIIRNNNIYDSFRRGVASNGIQLASYNSAWTISGNSFYETTTFIPTLSVGYTVINISSLTATGIIISNNYIGGSAALCSGTWTKTNAFDNSFSAITITAGTSANISVQGNTITGFAWGNSLNSSWSGINVLAGSVNIGTTTPNTIGAATGTGSISISSGSTGANVYGINLAGTGAINCSRNTIGSISAANASTFISNMYGIRNASTGAVSISGNTIANLSNTSSNAAGSLVGLYFNGGTTGNSVSQNFIHSLSAGAGAETVAVYGISANNGLTAYSNNIIALGGNTTTAIFGIYESGAAGNTNNVYFNTVYLGGSPTSGSFNSYSFYSASPDNTRDVRNNIFQNARSNNGASGTHYAAYFNYSSGTSLTLNYNDYNAPNTGGVLGYYNGSNVTSLPLISGQDANSASVNPIFINPGGTSAANYIPTNGGLNGIEITGFTTDFTASNRGASPTMGALEGRIRWTGSVSTVWSTNGNWSSGLTPALGSNIIIPNAALTTFSPSLPATTEVQMITIEAGGILNSLAAAQLTISGSINAWVNDGGTFNPNTSNVIFTNPAAELYGETNFYDITINSGASLTMETGSEMGIAGYLTNNGTWQNVAAGNTTVYYNGGDQIVTNPNGTPSGFSNLTISGTGTKTLTGVSVNGTLSMEGTSDAMGAPAFGSSASLHYNTSVPRTAGSEWISPFTAIGGVLIANTGAISLSGTRLIHTSVPLTINPGAKLSISPGAALTVNGTLNNNAGNTGLVLESSAAGDGKLLYNNAVSGTVELFLTGGLGTSMPKFHYFIPPVASVFIGSSIAEAQANLNLSNFNGDLLSYSEASAAADKDAGWQYFDGYNSTTAFSSLTSANAYNIYLTANDKLTFTGSLNYAAHSFDNLSYTSQGWNLIGNPYPCNYDLNGIAELTGADDDVDNSVYFNRDGRYVVYNLATGGETGYTDIVPPLQGFFVHVTATGKSLTLPLDSKTVNTTPVRSKKTACGQTNPIKKMKLVLSNSTVSDESIICILDNATSSFDSDYDAYKLFGINNQSPLIYSETKGVKYAINAIPHDDTKPLSIPLSLVIKTPGTYSIDITEFENLEGMNVVLKHGGIQTPLAQNSFYSFTSLAGTFSDFEVLIGDEGDGVGKLNPEKVKTYFYDNFLYIDLPENIASGSAILTLCDLQGKVVYDNRIDLISGLSICLPMNLQPGVYIARLKLNESSFVAKIPVQ